MKLRSRSGPARSGHEVRLGRDLAGLLERVGPGNVVVIDQMDLDPESARALIARGVHGVINLGPSLSGRFPTEGPRLLVASGVAVIDEVPEAAVLLNDGDRVELRGGQVQRAGSVVLTGRQRSVADLSDEMQAIGAAGGAAVRLQAGLADAASLLARRPDLADPDVDGALAQLIDGRAAIVVGDVLTESVDTLRASGGARGAPIVAAGASIAQELVSRGVTPDAVVVPRDSPLSISGGAGPVEVRASGSLPLLDDAVLSVVAAGAPSVVVVAADDGSWQSAVDRQRDVAGGTMLARVLTMGRAVPFAAAVEGAPGPLRTSGRRRRVRITGTQLVAIATATALVAGALLGWLAGGGPWAASDLDAAQESAASAEAARRAADDQLAAANSVLQRAEAALVANTLQGQRLVLVVAPGVPTDVVEGTQRIVTAAGATWSGTVTLQPKYGDTDQATSLDDIAVRLAPAEAELPSSAPAGARRDTALAAALLTSGRDVGAVSSGSAGLLSGLSQVGAVTTSGDPTRRAQRAVLLVPSTVDPSGATSPDALVGLARALGASGGAVVAAPGPPTSASTVGLLRAAVPAVPQVSTVDGVATAPGRLALIDALAAAADGAYAAFGPAAQRGQATASAAPTAATPQPTAP